MLVDDPVAFSSFFVSSGGKFISSTDLAWRFSPIVILLACAARSIRTACAVPRESEHFDPRFHVPDISESEDVPHAERSEPEVGCHWTSRLQFQLCQGGECHEAEILAFDFQRRAWEYYESGIAHGYVSGGPPIEEAFWIAETPHDELHASFDLCPGLVVVALLLVSEVQFEVLHSGDQPLKLAKTYMHVLQTQKPAEFDALMTMWPVELAQQRADKARDQAAARSTQRLPSVDIVIARCKTSLHWLWELPLPPQARLVIYEKCSRPEGELQEQAAGLFGKVAQILTVPSEDSGEWMTGECTAYLTHVLVALHGQSSLGRLADFTVFLHDDAPRHLKPDFLTIVFRALGRGSYDVPYLNLAHERYLQMATPCLRELYRTVFGRDLQGRLSTYCCGHFVVSAERVHSIPFKHFERLFQAVSTGSYAELAGGPCKVANMPCYVVEHIWHVLFGESDILPWRSEDTRLPLALRYEGGRETRLPSPLKFTTYMTRARGETL